MARTDATEIRAGPGGDPVLVSATELAFEPFLAQPRSLLAGQPLPSAGIALREEMPK